MSYHVAYDDDESVKGFPTFYEFFPDWMFKCRNTFFTVKDGQLYRHNSDNVPRNNFYGVQYTSKINTVINDAPKDDKIFKTFVQEGSHPWDVVLLTNLAEGTLDKSEFTQHESRWFTHLRKSEDTTDLSSGAQGIGLITANSGLTITFSAIPSGVNYGDSLYQVNGSAKELIGTIVSFTDTVITVNAITTTPVNGRFSYAKKTSRIEGPEIRGRYLEVQLETDETDPVELYAINTNAVKSYI